MDKDQILRAKGFFYDDSFMAWINRSLRIWLSHDVVDDHTVSELTEKMLAQVPSAEFHFHSNHPLSEGFRAATIARLNLSHLKPVNHAWN
jgi:hypothetical protein